MIASDSSDSQRQLLSYQQQQQQQLQSQYNSPDLNSLSKEQISLSNQNSQSSRKLFSRSCWEQHQIDDFFENFHQYIAIKFGNAMPLKSKYNYNCQLYEIFEAVRREESDQKKMLAAQQKQSLQQKSSSRLDTQDDQSSIMSQSPQLLSEFINSNNTKNNVNILNNNFANYLRTETANECGYFQNQAQLQQQQQQVRRIRTQSCDTAEDAFMLFQQQQQFKQSQQQFKMQQLMNPANSLRGRFSRKINLEHQYPNLIQEKRIPLQKQNNNQINNAQQAAQNGFSRQSSNNSISITKANVNQVNPFLAVQQFKKPRSITIGSSQQNNTQMNTINSQIQSTQNYYQNPSQFNSVNQGNQNQIPSQINIEIQQQNNLNNLQNMNNQMKDNQQQQYYSVNSQANKENVNPNINNITNNNKNSSLSQQNKDYELAHENLKKRIENIQANVKVSKADFMKRLYSNVSQNPSCQISIQSIDVSQLPSSNPTTQNHHQIQINQQKSHTNLQKFNENFSINQNTTENPISHLQFNNLINVGPQSRQQSQSNSSNDDHLNRNHLNNKLRTFAGRKALAEKEKQTTNQSTISNHPLAEQLREKVKKQWEINRESINIPQQQTKQNNNPNNNNVKVFIPYFQQNTNQIQQLQQQQQQQQHQQLLSNQFQQNVQYKPIKRIY
ncbi:hypothetical protein TTHERM_00197800 (macronuclear) [Tetrahymena thermophila SB210]|uniref:Uncharacterized protein n=1 Tax=Tetrahymena thermophila (strain SB210) TaxID=312017 RepID=Q22NR9_TETTS|nr:hypothetical protein TTHERM_00197800 [Tetrahymena thermophila SB210]EAR86716.1 hypothetical protein TTHERM_00197800 [Tetrahymena thermophila SB210]|eukprot:XP_001006961.1 hypothetical protein TTHERM_00197800 [Tetrahymena thermophila SB210]